MIEDRFVARSGRRRGVDERRDVGGVVGPGIDRDPRAGAAVDDVAVGAVERHRRGVGRAQPGDARAQCYHVFSNCGGKWKVGPARTSGVTGIVFFVSVNASRS